MSLSGRTAQIIKVALADLDAAAELVAKINADPTSVSPSSPVTPVAVTFTAGGTPTVYTTPTGALTIANSTTPTVVELLAYCDELRGNIAELQAVLLAQGLVT